MYLPTNNHVLIEIDTEDAKWGTGNDDSMLGADYNKGRVVQIGHVFTTQEYPMATANMATYVAQYENKDVLYNKGAEAGKTFEDDGKLYGLVEWWHIVGVAE